MKWLVILQVKNFGIDMLTNEDVENALLSCLKERDGQGTTSLVRNSMLDRNTVSRALKRLDHRGVIYVASGNGSTKRGNTWYISRNKDAPAYRLKTRKWDLDLFT